MEAIDFFVSMGLSYLLVLRVLGFCVYCISYRFFILTQILCLSVASGRLIYSMFVIIILGATLINAIRSALHRGLSSYLPICQMTNADVWGCSYPSASYFYYVALPFGLLSVVLSSVCQRYVLSWQCTLPTNQRSGRLCPWNAVIRSWIAAIAHFQQG